MKNYILNPSPFIVPTTDGKLIEEHVGGASTGTTAYSTGSHRLGILQTIVYAGSNMFPRS